MKEQGEPDLAVYTTDIDVVMSDFKTEIDWQCEHPMRDDPYLRVFFNGFRDLLKDERMEQVCCYMVQAKISGGQAVTPKYLANIFPRAFQKQILKRDSAETGAVYPDDYLELQPWNDRFAELSADRRLQSELFYDVVTRTTNTNIENRYVTVRAIANLEAERLGRPVSILDVGCSLNLGLKAVVQPDYEFAPFEHVATNESPDQHDPGLAHEVAKLVEHKTDFQDSTGTDYWTKKTDPDIEDWVVACFYPTELQDRDMIRHHKERVALQIPGLEIIQSDFGLPDVDLFNGEQPGRKYDLVTFVTMLYQIPPHERAVMIKNALNYLSDDGMLVVQDFAVENPTQPCNIGFLKNWDEPYTYRTFAYRNNTGPVMLRELAHSYDSRMSGIRLVIGSLAATNLV